MRPIPRKVVRELHAALKEAEELGSGGQSAVASQMFQNITARALVTMLAYMTPDPPEKNGFLIGWAAGKAGTQLRLSGLAGQRAGPNHESIGGTLPGNGQYSHGATRRRSAGIVQPHQEAAPRRTRGRR